MHPARPSLVVGLLSVGISVSAAQLTEEDLKAFVSGDSLPKPGQNVDGTSVFRNFLDAHNHQQFFVTSKWTLQYERPSDGGGAVPTETLLWCSNMQFSSFEGGTEPMGYTAQCIWATLSGLMANVDAGAEIDELERDLFFQSGGISAVYVAQTNVFECALYANTDNLVLRFWDDGRSTLSGMVWEVHDAGDAGPNAATSAFSGVAKTDVISADDAALLLGMNATDLTPDAFMEYYDEVWSRTHEEEAAVVEDAETEEGNQPVVTDGEHDASPGSGRRLARTATGILSTTLLFGV